MNANNILPCIMHQWQFWGLYSQLTIILAAEALPWDLRHKKFLPEYNQSINQKTKPNCIAFHSFQQKNMDQTFGFIMMPELKILTILSAQSLNKNVNFFTKLQFPNLHQTVSNTFLASISAGETTWKSFELACLHPRGTTIKLLNSTKSVSKWIQMSYWQR